MLAAREAAGAQVIWDLLHYGWPDWTNPFDASSSSTLPRLPRAWRAGRAGAHTCPKTRSASWPGAGRGRVPQSFVFRRGEELKHALCKAAIAATRRIRAGRPDGRGSSPPAADRGPPADTADEAAERAAALHRVPVRRVDCSGPPVIPRIGGPEDLLDVVGVITIRTTSGARRAAAVGRRGDTALAGCGWSRPPPMFGAPLIIAETGCEAMPAPPTGVWMVLATTAAATAGACRSWSLPVPVSGCQAPVRTISRILSERAVMRNLPATANVVTRRGWPCSAKICPRPAIRRLEWRVAG